MALVIYKYTRETTEEHRIWPRSKRQWWRSSKRRGSCTYQHWRRFSKGITMHGRPTPVAAHGILEVAEQQARPATSPSDVGQFNAPANFLRYPGFANCG